MGLGWARFSRAWQPDCATEGWGGGDGRSLVTASRTSPNRGQGVGRSERYVANHARGLFAYFRAKLRRESVPDQVVEQRVRAALVRCRDTSRSWTSRWKTEASRSAGQSSSTSTGGWSAPCGAFAVCASSTTISTDISIRTSPAWRWRREARRTSIRRLSCAQVMKTNPRTARENDTVRRSPDDGRGEHRVLARV